MQELLGRDPAPTAVFASNDRLAIGAVRAAVEAGLRVPQDVSIVGVDDIELAAYQTPPLTTVRQSLTDVATLATRILLDLLGGREPDRTQVIFAPELMVRQSTAPPPIQMGRTTTHGANPPTHMTESQKEVSRRI
jgi:DNA-binding LacI/PurR family transcriptional regulator